MIDLPTLQKKLNLHYTLSLDLFGSEVSTNAANAFNSGIIAGAEIERWWAYAINRQQPSAGAGVARVACLRG